MWLANQCLPDGNQILAGIMSLLKSILGKRKFLSMSMFRWCFLNFFLWWNGAAVHVLYLYLTATNNKKFIGKSLLTSFCAESSEKKKLGWSTIFHKLKSFVKAKIAQNNLQVSEAGIIAKPGQASNHKLNIWKVNPFFASVTCSQYQIVFKWSVNFWLQLLRIWWDGKYFNGWNFYSDILQIQENWASRNFITNSHVYSLLIYTQAKVQTGINNN